MAHDAPRRRSQWPEMSGRLAAVPRFRWYRSSTALAALTVAAVIVTGGATAAQADPTVADIERQIDEDWNRLEPVIERHNATRQDLAANRRKTEALTARIAPLEAQVDEAMDRVGALAARAYRGEQVRFVNTLLGSRSPSEVVAQLGALDRYAHYQQQDVRQASELRDELAATRDGLAGTSAELARSEADLAEKRRRIEAEIDRLQRLRLRAYGKGGGGQLRPAPCPASYPGGPAGEAVTFACAQIGKPYSWGAEGPNAYDCSGLILAAWARAGVALPHNAARQRQVTASVSRRALRPGDLVFYYRDLHHVGLYVGGGWVVHASRAGQPVKMKQLDSSPVHSFGRPG
ncbi:NlpC/P60 family protein [Micromonospora sp. LOL_024]|uniref:C40 family peptidase n=1 Tax=Micromonospora sp. LOL_024 TaxID=3345412 RepID=UPI003A8C5F3A